MAISPPARARSTSGNRATALAMNRLDSAGVNTKSARMGYRSPLAPKMAGCDDSNKQGGAGNPFFLYESSKNIWKSEIGATGVADRRRARASCGGMRRPLIDVGGNYRWSR